MKRITMILAAVMLVGLVQVQVVDGAEAEWKALLCQRGAQRNLGESQLQRRVSAST